MGKFYDGVQGIAATALYPLETVVNLLGEIDGKVEANDLFLLMEPLLRRTDRIFNALEDAIDDKFMVTYDMENDEITNIDIVKTKE